jgi:hypothetical protein
LTFGFWGCSKDKVEELKKEKLFTITIGMGEEEIGVVREKSGLFYGPSSVLFKNGFFYVIDSVNSKLLKITTPGDVILILAKGNPDVNHEDNILRTKERKYFEFDSIGKITVDNENSIYIENKVIKQLPETKEIDLFSADSIVEDTANEVFGSYILKFDRLGKYLYSIGIDGRGTDPFFYVYKMDIDNQGNLIVLTTNEEWSSWTFHKFDSEGKALLKSKITTEDIFPVDDMDETAFFVMDVVPVYNKDQLIYWVSLYSTSYDTKNIRKEEDLWGEEIEIEDYEKFKEEEEKDKTKKGRDLLYYKLLYYDIAKGDISKTYKWENDLGNMLDTTEEFFGIDGESNGFLWKYINSTKAIITINRPNGSLLTRRSFIFEDDGIWTNYQVAVDGSVSAIKIGGRNIHFYRWRSDKLISQKQEKITLKEFIRDKIQEFKNANR